MHHLDGMQPGLGRELYAAPLGLRRRRGSSVRRRRVLDQWPYGPDAPFDVDGYGPEQWESEVDLFGWARSLFGSTIGAAEAAAAVAAGMRDENRLTDILFFARHPSRRGSPIQRGEVEAAREWTQLRDAIVRPVLRALAAPGAAPAAPPPAPASPPPAATPVPFVQIASRLLAAAWNYRALGVTFSPDQARRIPCVLTKLLDARTDDRAVLLDVTGYFIGQIGRWHLTDDDWKLVLSPLRRELSDFFGNIAGQQSDADLLLRFKQFYDEQIARNMGRLRLLELPLGGGSGVPPGVVEIHNWVSRQQDNPQSIYSCYT